jgi:hypothetical protein
MATKTGIVLLVWFPRFMDHPLFIQTIRRARIAHALGRRTLFCATGLVPEALVTSTTQLNAAVFNVATGPVTRCSLEPALYARLYFLAHLAKRVV